MATCKECLHFEVCRMHYRQKCELAYDTQKEVNYAIKRAEKGSPICEHFKDRSRFVELPCKVGDTLFVPTRNFVTEYKIVSFHVCGEGIWYRTNVIKGILTRLISDNVENIGKTVFLTREEAEQALRRHESNAR